MTNYEIRKKKKKRKLNEIGADTKSLKKKRITSKMRMIKLNSTVAKVRRKKEFRTKLKKKL